MKKLLMMLMMLSMSILALAVLVSCGESIKVETRTREMKVADAKNDINDFVTIKQVVNKESISPNGEKLRYRYEVPMINIDKPGAQKINDMVISLEKDQEERMSNGQSMISLIKSKAFLNDGIISIVIQIVKPGSGGITVVNYDIQNDKEIDSKELLEKYKFDPQKLIIEINKQVEINERKSEEEQDFISIDYFIDTIVTTDTYNRYSNDDLKRLEEIKNKTKKEKEKYVIENIDKIKAYINNDGKYVFIHMAALEDEELVVE